MYFKKNISVLSEVNPRLAEALERAEGLETLISGSGMRTLKVNNVAMHSRYDPVKEAKEWARHYEQEIKTASSIIVYGFGLGYHIAELCKSAEREITVFEPRLEVLKTALRFLCLTSILPGVRIITGGEIPSFVSKPVVLRHRPSVHLNRTYFEEISNRIRISETINKGLRILVVSPVFGGSHPVSQYCAMTLKKMGHDVDFIDNSRFKDAMFYAGDVANDLRQRGRLIGQLSTFISETVIARCESFKPHLVLALAQAPLTVECLQRLRQSRVPTAFWFVEDFRVMDYWKQTAVHYDYFFTIQRGDFFTELEKLGVRNYHYLPMAAHPDVHKVVELSDEERKYYGSDISFVGAGYLNRREFFKGLLDFDLKIWGSDWDMASVLSGCIQRSGASIVTEEVVKIFNAANINVNLHSSTYHRGINPFGDFVNPRTFEIISSGGFQLVDRRAELKDLFEVDSEIVVFEDLSDLREKITHYLNNPREREMVIKKGRQRILRDHTYESRMQEMLEFIAGRGYEQVIWREEEEDVEALINEAGDDAELVEFLQKFSENGRVCLSDIKQEIAAGAGEISKTETMFLLMREFAR